MEWFDYFQPLIYAAAVAIFSVIVFFLKKYIDVLLANFADKKRKMLSYNCEMREKIIQLRVDCYSIKQNIDHKILFGIEISSFEEDRNKIIEMDSDIEKIRFENIHVMQCFKEVKRWLIQAIKDIEDWDLCRSESKKYACKKSVLDSQKEIDVHLKTLDKLIEKYYPAPK